MIFAKKIRMKYGCYYSNKQYEIDSIFLSGSSIVDGWYKKEEVYDKIKYYGYDIRVDIYPYPSLMPAISSSGEKYVRSVSDDTTKDNLMSLDKDY